jgi:hypothetical protein
MSFIGLASPTSLTGVAGDATTPKQEGEHCRSSDLVVDAADREVVVALTNWVIPISASKGHTNHGEVTTLAIHDDKGRRSNECHVGGQTMTRAA